METNDEEKMIWNKRGEEDMVKNYLIGFVLLTMFAVLILTVISISGNNYGKDSTEVIAGFNFTGLNNSLTKIGDSANSEMAAFSKQSIFAPLTAAGVVVTGIFQVGINIMNILFAPFTILMSIMTNTLEVPAIITGGVMAIFIFALIFGIWRLVRVGA